MSGWLIRRWSNGRQSLFSTFLCLDQPHSVGWGALLQPRLSAGALAVTEAAPDADYGHHTVADPLLKREDNLLPYLLRVMCHNFF